jgi:hypothetical protein
MSSSAPQHPTTQERRVHHDLRAIFEGACKVTAPCFDPGLGLGGYSLTTSARRVLHETYPELTQQEVALLFSAVRRFHQEKKHS